MGAQIFEAMPFEFYSENDGEFGEYQESTPAFSDFEWEEESRGRSSSRRAGFSARTPRGGGPRFKRPLPPDRKRPKKPRHRLPCPPGRRHCPPRGIVGGPYGAVSEPYPVEPTFPTEPEPAGSERIRWVQDCLNQASGLSLSVSGVMGPETRSAVRSFQKQQGLRVSGIIGPDTEDALKAACGSRGGRLPPDETEFGAISESERPSALLRGRPEMELPAEFRPYFDRLLGSIPGPYRAYWNTRQCYRLPNALASAPRSGGLYMLVWGPSSSPSRRRGPIGYVGKAKNLWERIRNYFWYARALGVDPRNYAVCFYPIPDGRTRGSIELAHRTALRSAGLVSNQEKLEMEQELWGDT